MSSQVTQSKVKAFAVNNTMLFFAVILFAACMIGVPRFATGGNLMNILIQVSINALIACGMTFVILSDGIDLSVGSVAAIAGVAGASLIKQMPDAGIAACIAVILVTAVVVGTICGSINGFCTGHDECSQGTCLRIYRCQTSVWPAGQLRMGGTSQHRSYSRINCINGYCNWALLSGAL